MKDDTFTLPSNGLFNICTFTLALGRAELDVWLLFGSYALVIALVITASNYDDL